MKPLRLTLIVLGLAGVVLSEEVKIVTDIEQLAAVGRFHTLPGGVLVDLKTISRIEGHIEVLAGGRETEFKFTADDLSRLSTWLGNSFRQADKNAHAFRVRAVLKLDKEDFIICTTQYAMEPSQVDDIVRGMTAAKSYYEQLIERAK